METMTSNARGWIHDVTGPLTGKNFRDPCNHLCVAVTKALVVLFFLPIMKSKMPLHLEVSFSSGRSVTTCLNSHQ